MFKTISIKSRLIISFVLVVILAVVFSNTAVYIRTRDMVENGFKEKIMMTVEQENRIIDNFFQNVEDSLSLLSTNTSVINIGAQPEVEGAMTEAFTKYTESYEDFLYVYIGLADGKMIMRPDAKLPDDFDPRKRLWYEDAVKNDGKVIWTKPYTDASSGQVIITAAKAVKQNGTLVGVLGADIDLSKFSKMVENSKLGNTGFVTMIDDEGKIILHKEKDKRGLDVSKEKLVKDMEKSASGFDIYQWENKKQYIGYTTNGRTGWKLCGIIDRKEMVQKSNSVRNGAIAIAILSILIAAGIGFIMSLTISRPIQKMMNALKEAEEGKLNVRIGSTAKDEIGKLSLSFDSMMNRISNLVTMVHEVTYSMTESSDSLAAVSEENAASSHQVAGAVDEIARGASDQAAEAQKSEAMIAVLSQKINAIIDTSTEMQTQSRKADTLNQEGLRAVSLLRDKSDESTMKSMEIREKIYALNDKSMKIGQIIEAITGISEQTNLLALNAAIEAARAGESGRGFAVVADEVRKLAEQSANAAKEIKTLITDIQQEAHNARASMDSVQSIVAAQGEAVDGTEQIFNKIADTIQSITAQISIVSEAVTDAGANKDEVVAVIGAISSISQQTAAASQEVSAAAQQMSESVEEVTKSAQDLNAIAQELRESISAFKL